MLYSTLISISDYAGILEGKKKLKISEIATQKAGLNISAICFNSVSYRIFEISKTYHN